ncbi:MAG: ArsR family transcriptional regulator [Chthoniobacteraceae bacterium]
MTVTTTTVRTIAAQEIFEALSDPTRRQILVSLCDGQLHAVGGMAGSLPKNRDNVRKHCAVLVKAGLITGETEPTKGKRQTYRLSPAVKAETTPTGRTLDFGCCILRC